MQCHAVSMMESCADPAPPYTQLNYLSTNGLQCYQSNKCQVVSEYHAKALPGAAAYYLHSDPVAQFMGGLSGACSGGSERWFKPQSTGGWRSTTKIITTIGNYASPGEGVLVAYGPAYGDTTNGQVMYMGGHDMDDGALGHTIAAQRTFFNFLLLAGKAKSPQATGTLPGSITSNGYDTLSVSVSNYNGPLSYYWSSSLGGTFSDRYDSITQYGAPYTTVPIETIITCVITDSCGRRTFISQPMTINPTPLPITLLNFSGKAYDNTNALLNWATATEINNDYFTISKSRDGSNFTVFEKIKSKGESNYTQYYSLLDTDPYQGLSYYKLSQTDFDGNTTDIKVIDVEITKSTLKNKIITWPNPFSDYIKLKVPDGYEGEVKLVIFDMLGKIMNEKNIEVGASQSEIKITSLDNIPKGNYIIKLYRGGVVSDAINVIKK